MTVNVQVLQGVQGSSGTIAGVEADSSLFSASAGYTGLPANVTITTTQNQDGTTTYTVTPVAGFTGVTFLEVTGESTAGAAGWDAASGVDPLYRAFVPVYVAPLAPAIASISANGQTVTGATFNNNSSSSTQLSFNVTGVTSGATVSIYLDGGTTAIATGTVASGATTATVTTVGNTANTIADGTHSITVKQTAPTEALTAYVNWSGTGNNANPGTVYGIPSSSLDSGLSAGSPLTVGLTVLVPPITSARVSSRYVFTVQTNAPSGDAITVHPVTVPDGMEFDGSTNTFIWTPTTAQLNSSNNPYSFQATVSDAQGRTANISATIRVILGLVPTQAPVNAATGSDVTVVFYGSNMMVYDNLGKAVLSYQNFKASDIAEVDLPAGQANSVFIVLPAAGAALPEQVLVNGASGAAKNQVTVFGTSGADSFTMTGNSVTANGLQVVSNSVQKLTLAGMKGNNDYVLNSGSMPTWIVNPSGHGTLDFSGDSTGVSVNLGLDTGQAQYVGGWNTTLMLYGDLDKLIGSQANDTLTGGKAALTYIHSGPGNDTVQGGTGDNILVGGGGSDTIVGGPNKNLIIGGSGSSDLYADGSSNTVFGGSTSYDTNDQALLSLLQQGRMAIYGYQLRLALAAVGGNRSLLTNALHFQDSGAHNTIFSDSPSNWIVPGSNGVVRRY